MGDGAGREGTVTYGTQKMTMEEQAKRYEAQQEFYRKQELEMLRENDEDMTETMELVKREMERANALFSLMKQTKYPSVYRKTRSELKQLLKLIRLHSVDAFKEKRGGY